MPFNQNGSNDSAQFQGSYNDVQGDQDITFIGTLVHGQNQTYQADTIIFNIGSIAESSTQQTSQPIAGPSNMAPPGAAQCPLQSWQRRVIAAADDVSSLIVPIVRLLENRTEHFDSYQDLELLVELLHHTMIMSRLAILEIIGPRGRNRTSTIEQAVFECSETLQKLFVKLEGHQDLRVTGIMWNHVPRRFQRLSRIQKRLEPQGILWTHAPRRFQRQELCRAKKRLEKQGILWTHAPRRFQRQELYRIKKRLETLLVALTDSLALTSYVDNFCRLHFTSLPSVGK